jgi:histidinol-phosphate aminotransferase
MLTAPLVTWRGHEELLAQQGTPAAAEPHSERLLASQPGMIRIDSNENPNGPGRRALDAIVHQFGLSNRYPVKETDDLTRSIANVQGVEPENVLLGCGSGELLRAAVYAFTSTSLALAEPEPTFEAPGNFAKFLSRAVNAPPVDAKLAIDLDTLTDAARNAGLVYFCNPNNPTATVHKASDVAAFVDGVMRASPDAVVLVDEAYHEYVADPGYATSIPIALANPRVIVTRTFSKVFGMAGLRVGYAVGQPATLKKMSGWLLGSNTNQLALAAATATIGDKAHIAAEVKRNAQARAYTRHFFESAGYTVHAAEANFMMIDIRRDPRQFKMDCAKHKVVVGRKFPSLPTYARVSIGTMAEMKKATDAFRAVLTSQVSASSH